MVRDNPELKQMRTELRDLISMYENQNWADISTVTEEQIAQSEIAENLAEQEMLFYKARKQLIVSRLKKHSLSQQEFGQIIGHESKTYMSELMNGNKPFTMKDLIVISKLLKINLSKLVPSIIPDTEKNRIETNIKTLAKPMLILDTTEFSFV